MKVSIVLPCYKSEKFIGNMINDVRNQSYTDWELIVVSNGQDQEAQNEVVQRIAETDSRIRLIKTSVPGVSHARNMGMDAASGDWLMFVDSDDRLMPDHIQKYVDEASKPENKDIDVIISGYWRKTVNESAPNPTPLKPFRGIDFNKISEHYTAAYVSWCKLLRIRTLRDWGGRFDETASIAEDGIFTFQLLNYTQKIVAFDLNGYIYVENPISAVGRYHECIKQANDRLKKEMVELFSRVLSKDELQQFIHNRNYYNATWEIHNLMQLGSPYSFFGRVREVHKILSSPELRHSLKRINLESINGMEKIKILLMKLKFSPLITVLYCLKK